MRELPFGHAEYAGTLKQTRREVFLNEMDKAHSLEALLRLIEPHYPKAGRGRCLRWCYGSTSCRRQYALSDPAMEVALYEIAPLRQFARSSLLSAIPDQTTMLHFRHLLGSTAWWPRC
jgi:IS5 family transposase